MQLDRSEEEAHHKAALADQHYREHLAIVNTARHDYFTFHLPEMLTVRKILLMEGKRLTGLLCRG
jgi:hypothetical protein